MEEIQQTIRDINATYGTDEWTPISTFMENNYTQAIAGMKLYDVMLVNSVIDGMNLVAKEGPIVNGREGVLILSETTGAYKQLHKGGADRVPRGHRGHHAAMHQALTMDPEERKRRSTDLSQNIEREDINNWLCTQLQDIGSLS